ncbi:MAG: site-specific integrase [Planctomycetia bacterium]|nr:site-specific integrase [Planctomycetia bacterium]
MPRTNSGFPPLLLSELLVKYLAFAEPYYGGRIDGIKIALRYLRTTYGSTQAEDFGPLALQAIIQRMVADDLSRSYIQSLIRNVRRIFKWAAANQLVAVTTLQALQCVSGPRKGKGEARETKPVVPVDDAVVESTLPHLPPVVADMVRLQRLVGCRPTELCIMRPCDVDRKGDVWSYRPSHHKTEHHGHDRRIMFGPKAQAILLPYLDRPATDYCFSPAEVVAQQNADKMKNPDAAVRRRTRKPKRAPGLCYSEDTYRRAITRACEQAFGMPIELRAASKEYSAAYQRHKRAKQPMPEALLKAEETRREEANLWRERWTWAPNRLRHSAATEIREKFGLEAASNVLGHSRADITQMYAARDWKTAERVARELG